jgi:hypothetical protein
MLHASHTPTLAKTVSQAQARKLPVVPCSSTNTSSTPRNPTSEAGLRQAILMPGKKDLAALVLTIGNTLTCQDTTASTG